ncbi:MAG: chromosome segregation protein SMC [Pseudomonadales bacterium]|nr:chromosome segregation protein SMC [Pseudomonadales bacterium]MCP5171990.1 chromosome segregation protein SMC [Pseudomonadales bacterium]
MRLKCIKLAGFKSFVDPTTVNFPSNLGAVVGPNGCGKSNIIDAVRWVMGESSAKNLRGESMTDVIFNGSGGRKPVGQASIELVFDNSDGSLGGEYASYAEISVKRKVTRDGQSNYYLNGNKCRRRDITDIFLGTGLGPRSYAIIEQGMISNLIEAKPDELRVFIEEAAGISKYKERRKDTESRMRRTMENLERLTDIRDELGRQLGRLQRQSQAAEKYAEYKKEERRTKAELQALRWQAFSEQLGQRQKQIAETELKVESLVVERSACETALEKNRSEYSERSDHFNEVQGHYYGVGGEVARLEQAIQHVRDRARELQQDLEQTEKNYAESAEHLRNDRHKAESLSAELEQIIPQLGAAEDQAQTSGATLQQAETAMQNWQQAWDDFNHSAAEPRQQAEVQQSRIQHLEQLLRRLAERIDKVEQEQKSFSVSPVQEEIEQLQSQLSAAEGDTGRQQNQINEVSARIDQGRQVVQQTTQQLDSARTELQTMLGRQASLEALQQAALGSDNEQQGWLVSHDLDKHPRLAEQLQVDNGWEVAVEAVLGNYLQAVCVDDLGKLANQLGSFEKGELLLVDSADNRNTEAKKPGNGDADMLVSKVSGSFSAGLLAGVYTASDLVSALALRSELANGESVITPDGIWLGSNWLRVVREKDASAGVLKRKQALEKLSEDVARNKARVAELSEQQQEHEEALRAAEIQRDELAAELAQYQKTHADIRSRLSASKVQMEQFAARRERGEAELLETQQQQQQEQENLAQARELLQQAIDNMEKDSCQREELLKQRDDARTALDKARQSARHDRDHHHELQMRERSVSTQLQSLQSSVERLIVQVNRLEERREQLRANSDQDDNPLVELNEQLEVQLEVRVKAEAELAEVRRSVEAVEHQMREQEKQRSALEQKIQEQRGHLEQQRLQTQEVATRSKTIAEQIAEHQFDVKELLAELPDDATESAWEEELERIGNRINRLGPINLAAIEEYKVEQERKTYLDAQNDELVEALKTLEEAIRKIDRETRTRFKETFEKINNSLQELFPKLFGGGHAYLELTGDDLLDTGVAIMARPPGKKNSTIHLLSGGEKAMTAIALVFSIFRLNPAPFCMLDEVDAPLDDANVGRYARMVKEMSDTVQFIYITHNKIAMEMAHQLLGVTMHEPGVSRLVTVDVNEAAELAEA